MAPDLPAWVDADEVHLRQVLLNLLGNAVKFTDRGHIGLRVHRLPGDGDDALLRFEVADSGVGIAAEDLSAIFLPFEQVGDVRRRRGGTGLGLSISRRLVRLMGGDLMVESTQGQGSLFWFECGLPLAASQQTSTGDDRTIVGYEGEARRILVVDNSPVNRGVLAGMLAPLGFEIDQADNGETAIGQAETSRPDLILTDIVLPELDGLWLIRRLRAHPGLAAIPVTAVSASASDDDRIDALRAGASGFLCKPVEEPALLRIIGELLGLTWVFATTPTAQAQSAVDFVMPGPAGLRELHDLALDGDMRSIRRWADRSAADNPSLAQFAAELRRLALNYQSTAIVHFVEQCRPEQVA